MVKSEIFNQTQFSNVTFYSLCAALKAPRYKKFTIEFFFSIVLYSFERIRLKKKKTTTQSTYWIFSIRLDLQPKKYMECTTNRERIINHGKV